MEKIKKENISIYYEPNLIEVIEILEKNSNELKSMNIKWTKESGFEFCEFIF